MKNALDEIAAQWQRETGKKVAISYAASNTLIKQIEQGAPADIFISADLDWMDYGQQKGLIKTDTRVNLLGNKIVLIADKNSTAKVDIRPAFDLAALLKGGRLAMGNVDAVPAGKYGKAALEKLGVLGQRQRQDRPGRQRARGARSRGARRDATRDRLPDRRRVRSRPSGSSAPFPADTHPPIIYPIALTKDSNNPDARAFLNFIETSEAAGPRLRKTGLLGVRPSSLKASSLTTPRGRQSRQPACHGHPRGALAARVILLEQPTCERGCA